MFNLGHPEAVTLLDVASTLIERRPAAASLRLVPWPADHERIDIGSFHGDFSKARLKLGWEPRSTSPPASRRTIAFYREHEWYLSST